MKPKISIITINFNHSDFILRCKKSVDEQKFKKWEWIIVDDGSTDQSRKILNSIKNLKIKIYYLNKNYGRGYARNYAIQKSKAEWCAILDMDDIMLPDRLLKIEKISKHNYDYFCSSCLVVDNFGNIVKEIKPSNKLPIKHFAHATLACKKIILNKIKYDNSNFGEDQQIVQNLLINYKGFFF